MQRFECLPSGIRDHDKLDPDRLFANSHNVEHHLSRASNTPLTLARPMLSALARAGG
jgi:hypothetical protein